jgi:hypothetical protein
MDAGWAWRCTPVIPATQQAEIGGSWYKASLGKSKRTYLKNKLKAKRIWVMYGSRSRELT